MNHGASPQLIPQVTIRVSGQLFKGHLAYLEQLVQSAAECRLWPVLSLSKLQELDRPAVLYLANGENRDFRIDSCPKFIRQRIDQEREQAA